MAQLVDLKVGFSCNNNCIHCVISDKLSEKDLTLEEIKSLIDSYIDEYKAIQLTLTGGEITIRKDFNDILDYVQSKKDAGLITFVDIQTNGRMMCKKEIAERASKTIDFFLIALHANESHIHDEITRAKGSFNQTVAALENLVELGCKDRIAIQTVINKKNYKHLEETYSFVYNKFGIKEFNITFPHPIGVCCSDNVVPSYEEVQKHVNKALDYCLENEIYPYIEALPFCIWSQGKNRDYLFEFLKKRHLDVVGFCGKEDGKLNYLELFDEGHVKCDSCSKCEFNSQCEGIWKEHINIYPKEDMYKLINYKSEE